MRRLLGPILVGIGAFLVVTGLLARFYAYPALAVAPMDQNSVTSLEADGRHDPRPVDAQGGDRPT